MAKVAATAQQDTFKLAKAYQETQKSTAELNQRTQAEDLLTRAEADPDYNSFDKYSQENEKIKTNSLQNLKDPEAIAKANYYQSVTNHQLGGIFKKKMVAHEQANTLQFIDLEKNNPTEGSFERIQSKLSEKVKQGFISEGDAYMLQEKANQDLGVNRISKDLYSAQTPDEVGAIKEAINSGFYEKSGATLDPVRKLKLFNKASKMETYLKNTQRDAVENDMAKREIDGDLTTAEVTDAFKNDLISRSFYQSRMKTLDSSLGETAHTDSKVYNEITAMMVNPEAKPTDIRNLILQKNAEGKLSQSDLKSLYTNHLIPSDKERMSLQQALGESGQSEFEKVKAMNEAQTKLLKEKGDWWGSAFKMIKDNLGNNDKTVAEAKQKVYAKVQVESLDKNEIVQVAREVLSENFLKNHPEVKTYPKEGKVVGGYRYFPDGTALLEEKK